MTGTPKQQKLLDQFNRQTQKFVATLQDPRKGVLRTAFSGSMAAFRMEATAKSLGAELGVQVGKKVLAKNLRDIADRAEQSGLNGSAQVRGYLDWTLRFFPQLDQITKTTPSPFAALREIKKRSKDFPYP